MTPVSSRTKAFRWILRAGPAASAGRIDDGAADLRHVKPPGVMTNILAVLTKSSTLTKSTSAELVRIVQSKPKLKRIQW